MLGVTTPTPPSKRSPAMPHRGQDEVSSFGLVPPAPIPASSFADSQATTPTLRKLEPYWHPFRTWAKQRWYGREILEVVSTEFRDRSVEYYKFALENGICIINKKPAREGYIIQNGDLLENIRHRHEPAITSTPVRIIHRDEENGFIVVDKPGSVPVHAVGRYFHHSLVEILKSDFGIEKPYTVNRLDRLTSGCMFIATRVETARMLTDELTNRVIKKEYVARVVGEFPMYEIVVDQPMICVDKQMGLNIVHPQGKPAQTIFNRIFYDPKSNTSVVHCQPLTGRSHQIRVHLQYVGHPIANDPVYSDLKVWGPNRGKGGLATLLSPTVKRSKKSGHVKRSPSPVNALPPAAEQRSTSPMREMASPAPLQGEQSESHVTLASLQAEDVGSPTPSIPAGSPLPPSTSSVTPISRSRSSTPTTASAQTPLPVATDATPAVALLPRETGADIGMASPVPLTSETVGIITKLRNMKDESEEYSRWRDVIFKTKTAMKMHGQEGVNAEVRERIPQFVAQQRVKDAKKRAENQTGSEMRSVADEHDMPSSSKTTTINHSQEQESVPTATHAPSPLSAEGKLLALQQPGPVLSPDGKEAMDPTEFPFCEECFVPLYPDPKPSQLYIYLHALRYTTSKWSYATEMPFWAVEGWEVPTDD